MITLGDSTGMVVGNFSRLTHIWFLSPFGMREDYTHLLPLPFDMCLVLPSGRCVCVSLSGKAVYGQEGGPPGQFSPAVLFRDKYVASGVLCGQQPKLMRHHVEISSLGEPPRPEVVFVKESSFVVLSPSVLLVLYNLSYTD